MSSPGELSYWHDVRLLPCIRKHRRPEHLHKQIQYKCDSSYFHFIKGWKNCRNWWGQTCIHTSAPSNGLLVVGHVTSRITSGQQAVLLDIWSLSYRQFSKWLSFMSTCCFHRAQQLKSASGLFIFLLAFNKPLLQIWSRFGSTHVLATSCNFLQKGWKNKKQRGEITGNEICLGVYLLRGHFENAALDLLF